MKCKLYYQDGNIEYEDFKSIDDLEEFLLKEYIKDKIVTFIKDEYDTMLDI